MTGVDYPTGIDTAFAYDAAGRALSMTDSTGTSSWSYDPASQLLQLIQPQGTLAYSYNAAGQRASMTETGHGTTSYAYDSAGRVASIANPLAETTSVQYDTLGRPSRNTFSSGQYEEFAYDSRWRPTGITLKNSSGATLRSQSYAYDAASQVLSHTVDGTATTYGYDAASQLVSETRSDYTGSYTYDGNGNLQGSSGNWQGPFGYAGGFGYQTESDSGLMLLGHRYLDPSTGRFLTRDPVKDGRNWYGYVGNDPV